MNPRSCLRPSRRLELGRPEYPRRAALVLARPVGKRKIPVVGRTDSVRFLDVGGAGPGISAGG